MQITEELIKRAEKIDWEVILGDSVTNEDRVLESAEMKISLKVDGAWIRETYKGPLKFDPVGGIVALPFDGDWVNLWEK